MDDEDLIMTQTQTQSQSAQCWTAEEDLQPVPQPRIPWGQFLACTSPIYDGEQRFIIFKEPLTLNMYEEEWKTGRGDEADFVFRMQNFPNRILCRISKTQFKLNRDLSHPLRPVFIQDCSRNGTFLNSQLIGNGNRRIIKTGDVIAVLNKDCKIFVFQDLKADMSHGLPNMITSKYFIGPELGTGACGIVRMVWDLKTCGEFAMKQIGKNKLEQTGGNQLNDKKRILNEVNIMKKLDHPCIVRMYEFYDDPESVFMSLELMRGGDMIKRISETPRRRLPEQLTKFYFLQMCEATKYLHDNGITHRDIKPDNILLASSDEESLLKITDFGLSKFVQTNSEMKTLCGTPQYVAPEILTTRGRGSYTKKVDIWSLGCCLYACLAGCVPFTGDNMQSIAHNIVKAPLKFDAACWMTISNAARDLVKRCLTKNPQQRPSIEELMRHRWLDDEAIIAKVERIMGRKISRPQQRRMTVRTITGNIGNMEIQPPRARVATAHTCAPQTSVQNRVVAGGSNRTDRVSHIQPPLKRARLN